MSAVPQVVKNRPAETATPVAMAVALLIASILGIEDVNTIGYIAIVVAFVPAAVTWLVTKFRSS